MIQLYLMNELKGILPALEWSIDFYSGEDNTGTVYYEGGASPDLNDMNWRYPSYMVYIRSSDWRFAEQAAQAVYNALHKRQDLQVQIEQYDGENVVGVKTYHVLFIQATSEPLRIGVDNNIMDYSVNFQVTLREVV
jgi:hypothetical protein